MSLSELKAEIAQLSADQLEALRHDIEAELAKKQTGEPKTAADFLGCARGMMKLNPGWDDPEPLEQWNAERDDTPL